MKIVCQLNKERRWYKRDSELYSADSSFCYFSYIVDLNDIRKIAGRNWFARTRDDDDDCHVFLISREMSVHIHMPLYNIMTIMFH